MSTSNIIGPLLQAKLGVIPPVKPELGTRLICANQSGVVVVDQVFDGKDHCAKAIEFLCSYEEVGPFAHHHFEPCVIAD